MNGRRDQSSISQVNKGSTGQGQSGSAGPETGNTKKRKLNEQPDSVWDVPSEASPNRKTLVRPSKTLQASPIPKSPRTLPGSRPRIAVTTEPVAQDSAPKALAASRTKPPNPSDKSSISVQAEKVPRRDIPFRPPIAQSPKAQPRAPREKPIASPASTRLQTPKASAPRQRRPRLIDRLVAQAEPESEDEDDATQSQSQKTASQIRRQATPETTWPSTPPTVPDTPRSRTATQKISIAKKSGPKFTYGVQRTMLAEDSANGGMDGLFDLEEEASLTTALAAEAVSNPFAGNLVSAFDEGLEDEDFDTGAVRSIHELRQAGANSRFADEMDDIFDRIGLPGGALPTLRRGALLELAQKMPDTNFRRQFRNHLVDGKLFRKLNREADTISGFAILAILVHLFASSKSPHLIKPLESEGFPSLLAQLLGISDDISAVSKDRKSNLSRNAQQTVAAIKASLLRLTVWEPVSLSSLSSRTLALKCVELMVSQSASVSSDDQILSPALIEQLFGILSDAIGPTPLIGETEDKSIDALLTLHLLESHSVMAMQSQPSWMWSGPHLSVIADLLGSILKQPTHQFGDLEGCVLRLVLNATNNSDTPAMLVSRGLLSALVDSVSATFDALSRSMVDQAARNRSVNAVVFMLCILINFCEHYPRSIERLQELRDAHATSLDGLFSFFYDYQSRTGDADSVEKGEMNVAFGYLSVLLGYLCLSGPIRKSFCSAGSGNGITPLLDAIREFITIRRISRQPPPGSSAEGTWSEANDTEQRLHGLVSELRSLGR